MYVIQIVLTGSSTQHKWPRSNICFFSLTSTQGYISTFQAARIFRC
jgi:hypothetical protein